jgi:hypothetical protein
MSGELTVCSWVEIGEGCPINVEVGGSGVAFVRCGPNNQDAFEFHVAWDALRELVRLGGQALQEMDAIYASTEAGT